MRASLIVLESVDLGTPAAIDPVTSTTFVIANTHANTTNTPCPSSHLVCVACVWPSTGAADSNATTTSSSRAAVLENLEMRLLVLATPQLSAAMSAPPQQLDVVRQCGDCVMRTLCIYWVKYICAFVGQFVSVRGFRVSCFIAGSSAGFGACHGAWIKEARGMSHLFIIAPTALGCGMLTGCMSYLLHHIRMALHLVVALTGGVGSLFTCSASRFCAINLPVRWPPPPSSLWHGCISDRRGRQRRRLRACGCEWR